MEIVRKDFYVQDSVSTDLNNVATEVSQTVKSSGISTVATTFEVFDPSKLGMMTTARALSTISNAAEYVDPATALARQVASPSSQEMLKIVKDPKFDEISTLQSKKSEISGLLDKMSQPKGGATEKSQLQSMKTDAGERFDNAMNTAVVEFMQGAAGEVFETNKSRSDYKENAVNKENSLTPSLEEQVMDDELPPGSPESQLLEEKNGSAIKDFLDELKKLLMEMRP